MTDDTLRAALDGPDEVLVRLENLRDRCAAAGFLGLVPDVLGIIAAYDPLARPAVPSLDPYSERGEHERQSLAGTHNFDPQCPFCFFDAFDAEKRAEYAASATDEGVCLRHRMVGFIYAVPGCAACRAAALRSEGGDR